MELVTAIVGIADITARASSKAWKLCDLWRDTPRDIFQLRDELDRSTRFFLALHDGVKERFGNHGNAGQMAADEELVAFLKQGCHTITSLQNIMDDLISDEASTASISPDPLDEGRERVEIPKRRKLLWLRRLKEVRKLKTSLSHVTTQIGFRLTFLNLSISAELPYDIRETESRLITHLDDTIHSSAQDIARVVQVSRGEIEHHVLKVTAATTQQMIEDIYIADGHRQVAYQQNLAQISQGIQSQDRQLQDMRVVLQSIGQSLSGFPRKSPWMSDVDAWTSMVEGTTGHSSLPSSFCGSSCKCQCHSTRSYGNWESAGFQHILGAIKVSFYGTLSRNTQCTDRSCKNQGRYGRLVVRYAFPAWVARAMVSLFFAYQPEPELLIRVHREIPPDRISISHSIFATVYTDQLEGVRAVLRERPSAAHDVRAPRRATVLHVAVHKRDIPLVRLLIQAGSDPFQETTHGMTRIGIALEAFLLGQDGADKYPEFMPFSQYFDDQEFTELHRAVSGIMPLDLATALRSSYFRSQVNTKTQGGIAPLHIAALRSDANAVRLLLEAGAQVDQTNVTGATPLHEACRHGDEEIISLLLASGASPNQLDFLRNTSLHFLVANPKTTTRVLNMLVEYGAAIDPVANLNATPLCFAVGENSVVSLKYLICKGANVNNRDWEGDVPLNDAINVSAHECIEILLRSGANYRTVNDYGRGVLHILAERGDKKTADLLAGAGLTGLDVDQLDNLGKTALDVFNQRTGVTAEFRATFHRLLGTVRAAKGMPTGPHSKWHEEADVETDEEFFDASNGFS